MTQARNEDLFRRNVESASDFLDAVELARGISNYLCIHLFWVGCRNACGPHGELDPKLDELFEKHSFNLIDIPWRTGTLASGTTLYDYRKPPTEAYLLFRELVQCKVQQLGGFGLVDSYSAPPWDRPHFPQLFFLDTREIDSIALGELKRSIDGFEDEDEFGKVIRKLFSDSGEVILTLERIKQGADPSLDESYFQDDWMRQRLRNLCPARGVLIQLVNEHLFKRPDLDLQVDRLEETIQCIVGNEGPRNCFSYLRGPIIPVCK